MTHDGAWKSLDLFPFSPHRSTSGWRRWRAVPSQATCNGIHQEGWSDDYMIWGVQTMKWLHDCMIWGVQVPFEAKHTVKSNQPILSDEDWDEGAWRRKRRIDPFQIWATLGRASLCRSLPTLPANIELGRGNFVQWSFRILGCVP